jgi:hypothetical protein
MYNCVMAKRIAWSEAKNRQLRAMSERGVCFDDVVVAMDQGRLLDDIVHPAAGRFPRQRMFVVEIAGYAYAVPYVESDDEIFLKTLFPSRRLTRRYLGGKT